MTAHMSTNPDELMAPDRLLNHIHHLLVDAAEQQGGQLSVARIETLLDSVRAELAQQMDHVDPEQARLIASSPGKEDARKDFVGRIVVKQFAHLLSAEDAQPTPDHPLPRTIVPPFFRALRMMVGAATLDHVYDTLDTKVQSLTVQDPPLSRAALWETLETSPEAVDICVILFVKISVAFDGRYDTQITWLETLINTVLGISVPASNARQAPADQPEQGWYCQPPHCVAIIRALSQTTVTLLARDNGPRLLEEQFGEPRLTSTLKLLDSLGQTP